MTVPIRAGLVLGVLVVLWTFVMGFTGWYRDPTLLNLFFLVIPLEIVVVLCALRKTAPDAGWGGQLVNGLVLSLAAGVIVFGGSMVFTTVAFPDYFADIQAAHEALLRAQGLGDADVRAQVAAAAAMQTPLMNALSGFIGTLATGVVVAAVAGAFWRKRT